MWNNAGKVKLGKNMNESKTYLLLPMTWATHDNYPSRGRSRRSPSASALAAEYAWRAEGQLFCIILHLGDHPLPCLHVGRYLDGWGDGAWQKASRKKEGRVLFFILGFRVFCFFVLGCFFFFFFFATNPFSTTSRALAHKGAETRTWQKGKRDEKNRKEPRTAIQSTRPSCKHAECVRHQVVYMLKRMLPIRYLFGYTRGARNRWSRTV